MFKLASRIGKVCVLAGVVGFTSLFSAGCVENQPTIVVLRHVFPSPDSEDCEISPDSPTPLKITADVSIDGPIALWLVVTNQQPDVSPDDSNTLTNTSEVTMKEAIVKLNLPQVEGFEPLKFKVPLPADRITGSDEFVYQVDIPAEQINAISPFVPADSELIMNVTVTFVVLRTGNNVSGKLGEIEGRAYRLPVYLCNGCSLSCLETFANDAPSQELCFARGNCEPPTSVTTCGGIENVTAFPRCCDGSNDFAEADCP